MPSRPRLLALDTASLYFRAFYGVPDSLKAPDGTPVNAVRGLLDFVATLADAHSPDVVVACWDDAWRPQWRVDLLPTYKTHRLADPQAPASEQAEESPEGLTPQVPLIREALGLLGIPVVGAPDAEADDVLGTYAVSWDGPVDVVTGDRDLFQLVDDAKPVRVLYTARGVRQHDVVDEAWVRDKYGIEAAQYVDYAVMRGDASDGLPGVPGIGEKTAAGLLGTYPDVLAIAQAAHDDGSALKPRVRQSLRDSLAYITAAVEVVTVKPDLPNLPQPAMAPPDLDGFAAFAERWNLGGSAQRVLTALGHPTDD